MASAGLGSNSTIPGLRSVQSFFVSVYLPGNSPGKSSGIFLPLQGVTVSDASGSIPALAGEKFTLAVVYRRCPNHRDSPALPLGGLGLDKVMQLSAKLQAIDAKVIGNCVVPFVIPFFNAENNLDVG